MKPNRRRLGGFLIASLAVALLVTSSTLRATNDFSCDTHGPGTDRLCLGDHMFRDQYLVSASGQYRFYFQSDGHGVVYDEWNNHAALYEVFPTFDYAYHFRFGDRELVGTYGRINMGLYSFHDEEQLVQAEGWWDPGLDVPTFLVMDDDGFLKIFAGHYYQLDCWGAGCWA